MARKKVANRLRQIGDDRGTTPLPPMPGRASESQLVELGLFISVTFVGTLVLIVLAVIFGIGTIEGHLESSAERAIQAQVAEAAEENPEAAGRTEVDVVASGVDVHLRGTVGLEDQIGVLPELVNQIEGVGTVTADLVYVEPVVVDAPKIVAEPITIVWASGQATITGEVSDEPSRAAFLDTLGDQFPNGVNSDGFTIKEGAPSERDWLSRILTLAQIGATSLSEGEMFVSADDRLVRMTGEYQTRQERREARDAIDDVMGGLTFAFVNGLSIPEAPEFTPEDVVELQENLDDLIEGKVVEFELNSDVLTSVGAALLDEIIDALEKFPNVPIEIGGHTDNQGDAAENLDLSERRADTALQYLVAHGQDPVRFVVVGYGEDQPVASNDNASGRARNRRIEFKALGE